MRLSHHQLKALRPVIESEIERMIAALDLMDGDCEDEGAQCEDEGACADLQHFADDEDDPCGYDRRFDWLKNRAADERITRAAVKAVENLRAVQRRQGKRPVQPLRVLAGSIMRG